MLRMLGCAIVWGLAACAAGAEPVFTRKPAAVKTAGGAVRLEFAVDRETDVAVFVEDAKGGIVRHLVAGVLGKNPPAPLKPGLAQSIEWDGKDDAGQPAAGGPFKIRVALGLGAKYDRVVHSDPQSLGSIRSLAVGPDGTLYIRASTGSQWPNGTGEILVAWNRDGSYSHALMPYPSSLPKEKVPGVGTLELDGRPAPVVRRVSERDFYGATGWIKSGMAVAPGGEVLFPVDGPRLAAVGSDGSLPWGGFAGPSLLDKAVKSYDYQRIFLAVSSGGGEVFVSGLRASDKTSESVGPLSAVYRVKLPGRGPVEAFFGDAAAAGAGEARLGGAPTGLALDGKGHLLVGDPGNKRVVVVSEKDGAFAGFFPVENADCVAADPASGAVFVTRLTGGGGIELVKFSGWKEAKVLAQAKFPNDGNPELPWVMALDAGAKPPAVWLGGNNGRLMRIEDQGAAFGEPKEMNAKTIGNGDFNDLSVDRARGEVFYRATSGAKGYRRFSEADGAVAEYTFSPKMTMVQQVVPGPDGNLYAHGYPAKLERFDRAGQPVPWAASGGTVLDATTDMYVNLGHQLGLRGDGRIFAFENPIRAQQRNARVLREYDAGGKALGWGPVWHVSEVAVGPKFDRQGNIYVAEQIRPKENPFPAGMEDSSFLYGSIVKFSPKGGLIGCPKPPMPPDGSKPSLDASLQTVDAVYVKSENRLLPVTITGAEWIHMGISHIEHAGCTCESTRFDVDDFGRVFYPDLCRFRVVALDTNGNEITRFGGYGNAESMGPESPVIDRQTGKPRPRRANDPKDLESPFAEPEIAFAWLIGVGVTDRYAYMGDTLNRRLLRAKLVYATEETCAIAP